MIKIKFSAVNFLMPFAADVFLFPAFAQMATWINYENSLFALFAFQNHQPACSHKGFAGQRFIAGKTLHNHGRGGGLASSSA